MLWKDAGRTIQRADGTNVTGLVPSRMTAADRLLVVAGPELLEALRHSLDVIYNESQGHRSPWVRAAIVKIDAAIAKATGSEATHGE
jgi:hypothetical protein